MFEVTDSDGTLVKKKTLKAPPQEDEEPVEKLAEVDDKWSGYVKMFWDDYDRDGSGQLSYEEAVEFMTDTFSKIPPCEFERQLALIDRDSSGTYSQLEMAQFMRDNYELQ